MDLIAGIIFAAVVVAAFFIVKSKKPTTPTTPINVGGGGSDAPTNSGNTDVQNRIDNTVVEQDISDKVM
jgi:MFS superfamily sulfate permease-like transporter